MRHLAESLALDAALPRLQTWISPTRGEGVALGRIGGLKNKKTHSI